MLRRATNNEVMGKNRQSRNVTAGAQTQAAASKGSISNFQKRQVAAATGGEGMDMAAKWDPFGANHYSEESNPWAGFFGQPAHPWKTSSYQKVFLKPPLFIFFDTSPKKIVRQIQLQLARGV
jgi:hypothetical protein